jgi:hypothetical protein
MQLIQDILYLDWAELEAFGVPFKTIDSGTMRNRNGNGKSWVSVKDPADGRRNLVRYDSIPAATFKTYQLPSVDSLKATLAKQTQKEGKVRLLSMLPALSAEAINQLGNYRIKREVLQPGTGELQLKDMGGLPSNKLQGYLNEARWLELCMLPVWKVATERKRLSGFATAKETMAWIAETANEYGVKLPKAYSQLLAKIENYKAQGIISLVHKAYANRNAEKVNELGEALLMQLAADRRKPNSLQVAEAYERAVAESNGLLSPVSDSTIKRWLRNPEIAQQIVLNRDGYSAWKNTYQYKMKGRRPSFSDAIWYIDGTKHNIYYRETRRGQQSVAAKLNMIAVLDGHTDAMVGWVITEKENNITIGEAVRHAIKRAGNVLPHQFLYDQDSANLAFFKNNYIGTHWPAMANNGESKLIERAFGRFQDTVLRGWHSFTGMNITAKSSRSRVNNAKTSEDEHLKLPISRLPSREEAIAIAEKALRIWNSTLTANGKTRWENYMEGKREEPAMRVSEMEDMQMFWQFRESSVQYSNNGLIIERNKVKYSYEVYQNSNGEQVPDVEFNLRYMTQNFWIKEDLSNPKAPIALFLKDSNEQLRFVAFAHKRNEVARAVADYDSTTKARIEESLKAKKKQQAAILDRAKENGAMLKSIGFNANVEIYSKEAEARAEAELYEELFGTPNKDQEEEAAVVPITKAPVMDRYQMMMQLANKNFNN